MKEVKKAVIPVAGMGTRFLPGTKAIPKEMFPIIDKPALQYIVEEVAQSGITDILFITSPSKNAIMDHFDRNFELEERLTKAQKIEQLEKIKAVTKLCRFQYVRQGEPLGSGHAINLAKSFVGDEPFAVLYGDDIIKSEIPALKQLIETYKKYDSNVIGMQKVSDEVVDRYGIIDFKDESTKEIKTIVEKPKLEDAPSRYAGLGRYIVKPEIFDELANLKTGKGGEYQFTDAMLNLMQKQPFYGCEYDGEYFDIGSKDGYIAATLAYALDREDLKEQTKTLIKKYNR